MSGFDGKRAVVTGAASGIGRALAWRLAADGAEVVGWDLDGPGLEETASASPSGSVRTRVVDASDAAQVADAVAALDPARVDLLFNVAGVILSRPLLESTTADLVRLTTANLGTLLTATAAVAPLMPEGAVVVNTTSSLADRVRPGFGVYGATKAAVITLTEAWALELAERGVRVCAVGPGMVDTPMPRAAVAHLPEADELLAAGARMTQLIGRLARPEQVADAMCLVASDAAAFSTGRVLWIDGGAALM